MLYLLTKVLLRQTRDDREGEKNEQEYESRTPHWASPCEVV